MALRQGYLKLGGLTLHHTYGGLGRPVVFIHGLGSSGYIEWRFNLEHFARTNRVFAPDLPGYGKSDKPRAARYGIPYFARTIDRYLESRRIHDATIVGTSMGGRIALEVALRYPSRVSRLVVVNSLGLGRPKMQPYYPMMLVPRVGETLLRGMKNGLRWAPSPVIRRFAARFIGARGDLEKTMSDEYLDDLREMYSAEGYPDAYLATVRSIASPRDSARHANPAHAGAQPVWRPRPVRNRRDAARPPVPENKAPRLGRARHGLRAGAARRGSWRAELHHLSAGRRVGSP